MIGFKVKANLPPEIFSHVLSLLSWTFPFGTSETPEMVSESVHEPCNPIPLFI